MKETKLHLFFCRGRTWASGKSFQMDREACSSCYVLTRPPGWLPWPWGSLWLPYIINSNYDSVPPPGLSCTVVISWLQGNTQAFPCLRLISFRTGKLDSLCKSWADLFWQHCSQSLPYFFPGKIKILCFFFFFKLSVS